MLLNLIVVMFTMYKEQVMLYGAIYIIEQVYIVNTVRVKCLFDPKIVMESGSMKL